MSMFDLSSEDYTGESQFSQLTAGVNVPAKLVAISVDEESGDLIFSFKGTNDGDVSKGVKPNNGTFNHRVWANNFDPENEYYDETWAKRYVNQTKHILKAFLTPVAVDAIHGATWLEFAQAIVKTLPKEVFEDTGLFLKVILDNKNRPQFPVFPDFISSPAMPKALKLDTRINKNTDMPYERIHEIEIVEAPSTAPGSFGAGTTVEVEAPVAGAPAAAAPAPTQPAFGS